MISDEIVFELNGITKQYPGVLAVNNMDLTLHKGEILGLVGENGAGKSTIIKMISGAETPTAGTMKIAGKTIHAMSPAEAIGYGISTIYQELNFISSLSVAENIFVGRIPTKGVLKKVNYKTLYKNTNDILQEVELDVSPRAMANELSIGALQLMEIARNLVREVKIMIFDEPTSALTIKETENLFRIIKKLSSQGIAIIYISHKLDEIFTLTDNIKVICDGNSVAYLKTPETDVDEVIRNMVGRDIKDYYAVGEKKGNIGEVQFRVEALNSGPIQDMAFDVKKGEILGIYGLMGSGQTEIAKCIFGALKRKSGTISIDGKKISIKSPEDAIKNGMVYLPADRKQEGLILTHTIRQNISIIDLRKICRFHFKLSNKKDRLLAREWIQKLDVRTTSSEKYTGELSGGNQQKVVLAKYLSVNPKIIIMNEPTRGIDVGAKQEIYRLMHKMCQQGMSIIMISSEIPEVMAMSDRIIVVSNGKITGECTGDEITQIKLMKYAIGENL